MKAKKAVLLFLLFSLLIGTAYAQDTRIVSPGARLSFSGTKATCYVIIPGAHGDDVISATIQLRCGSQNIETWNRYSNNGFLEFQDNVTVTKGKTYELTVDYTVNGNPKPQLSASGTC